MRKESKRLTKRITAWVLTLVMVLSLVMVPTGEVQAAESVTVTDATDSGKDVYVVMTVEKTIEPYSNDAKNWPTVQLTQYKVSIVNNTDTTISDWQLTIGCTSALNSTTYNSGWNGAPSSVTGTDIVVTTYKGTDEKTGEVWDNATIEAGKTLDTGAGFQVATSSMSGATYTLTYNVGESSGNIGQDDTQTDPAQIGTTNASVTSTITESNIAGDYHEYYLQVNNGLSESISDWIVAIPLTGITSSEAWGSWAKVKVSYTSSYLYLTPASSSDNVIASNGTFGSTTVGDYKFNYKGSSSIDTSKAVVYYKTGSASTGAFDNVVSNSTQASGSSSGESGGGTEGGQITDTTTDLNLDIEYNYAKLLQESLYFYDANMCGTQVGETCGLSWRGDCHGIDATNVSYNGKTLDLTGGFHDAGDHVKFGLPQGYAATMLALSYYEFGAAYDELGQKDHLKIIMDYFCDYFVSSTVYNGTSVEAFCYQVGEGNSDHGYWGSPEKQTTSRPAYFATSSNPATDEVSVAIAALALNYKNFGNEIYLKTAKDLFTFVKNNSKSCATEGASGFYASGSWKDDYCCAAAALYIATGDESYKTEFTNNYNGINSNYVLNWNDTWGIAAFLMEDWGTVYSIANYGNTNTAQGFKFINSWGSARYNTTSQFLGLLYDHAKGNFTTASGSFCSWATGQMKYLLGNNTNKRCFVVGYNENSSKYPHHRAASNSTNASIVNESGHYTLLGALVGGPSDVNDGYKDDQADYNCNEVALDYNAGFVGAAAGLYLLHKNDASVPATLATSDELSEIGVTKYYGEDTASTVTAVSLDKTTLALEKGETATLVATVETSDDSEATVTWSSSNEKVATVDDNGKVTAVAGGTATITAKAGSKSATCAVTVTSAVTGVSLDKTALTLEKGENATLTATVAPTDATNKSVTWESDKEAVATVDSTGKVTAKASGTATITVTTADGAKTATCVVTVINPVKSISLSDTNLTINKGETKTLEVTITPSDADDHTIQFSSDNTAVATVDATSGEITAISTGDATITVTVTQENGTKSFTKTCDVKVVVPLTGIAISAGTLALTSNGDNTTGELTITPQPEGAVLGDVTWTSSDESVATVAGDGASATVTAKKSGTTTITAACGGYTATSEVTVTTLLESVAFNETLMELEVNEEAELICTITPADADIEKIEWKNSDDTSIEVVGENAIVDGKVSATINALAKTVNAAEVEVSITPKEGDVLTDVCKINVVGKKVTGVDLQDDSGEAVSELSMILDDEKQLTAIVTPEDADNKTVTWTSNNSDVATVDETGKVTAVGAGEATITAQAGNIKTTCTVTVAKKTQDAPEVTFTVNSRTAHGFSVMATPTWSSEANSGVIEISMDGGKTWSDTGIFSGLQAFTAYTVCVRAKENDTYEASEISANTKVVYTLVENPYIIDVSKLATDEATIYADALRTETGTATVEYNQETKVLTLVDTEGTYTLTGVNKDLMVVAPNGCVSVVLDNATIKQLDVTKQNASASDAVDVKVKGTSQVDSIVSNGDSSVTLTGNGTLNADNIDVTGSLTIAGPTVNADASETDKPTIKADNITISSGNVTALGGNDTSAIVGDNVTISGGTVTATGGEDASAITGDTVTITGGTVTVTGGENASAIAGENITIAGGTVTATGGTGAAAIESTSATGSVTIKDADVTVNAGEGSQKAPIESDNIVLSGNNQISSETDMDKIYSSTPKDPEGNELKLCNIVLYEADGETELSSMSMYAGNKFILPEIEEEKGCVASWLEKGTGKSYEPKTEIIVETDMNFVISVLKIKVTKITLDTTMEKITVGDGVALAETVEPANAYDTSVVWTSSNPAVATVDADGKVTGVAPGVAIITATAKDGSGISASCTVTVIAGETEADAVEVTGIKITGDTKKVAPGKKLKLTATIYPENATNQEVVWKVNNTKYATVNSNGVVTTKKAGKGKSVTVTAYSAEDDSIKATYKISIMKNAVKKIKLSAKTKIIKKGKSVTIKAQFTPSKGISKELTWTSSNKKIATVNSKGKVTGKKKGTVKITAKAKDGSGKKATIKIKVK